MTADRPPEAVTWHDVECGAYSADLPLWRELAAEAGGPVLDVGAGTGRVALDLAGRGHDVTALDVDPVLLGELARRARELPIETFAADARDFDLEREFALVLVPMQTMQILGGPEGRAAFLRCAHRHLQADGRLAAALAGSLAAFEPGPGAALPLPDVAQHGGWAYFSQPVRVRTEGGATVIERVRQSISPDGERRETRDAVRLDPLDAATVAAEAGALGFAPLPPRAIPATEEHVGSTVVVLARRTPAFGFRTPAGR